MTREWELYPPDSGTRLQVFLYGSVWIYPCGWMCFQDHKGGRKMKVSNWVSFISSDRSSYSDDGLLYIRGSAHFFRFSLSPLMQLLQLSASYSSSASYLFTINIKMIKITTKHPLLSVHNLTVF